MNQKVKELFETEFSHLTEKFHCFDLPLAEAKTSNKDTIWKPGVYVFLDAKNNAIKVGRSLTNSRKRAFEHIRDNTGGMANLKNDSTVRLLLFNVKETKDKHWVAALEIYLEEILEPSTPSKRLG